MASLVVQPPIPDCECIVTLKGKEGYERCSRCGHWFLSAGKEIHEMFHIAEDALNENRPS